MPVGRRPRKETPTAAAGDDAEASHARVGRRPGRGRSGPEDYLDERDGTTWKQKKNFRSNVMVWVNETSGQQSAEHPRKVALSLPLRSF